MPKNSSPASLKFAQFKTKYKPKLQTFVKNHKPFIITMIVVIAIIILLALIATISHHSQPTTPVTPAPPAENNNPSIDNPTSIPPEDTPTKTPEFINLQPTVDAWLKTISANVGLMIYDLDNNRVAASHQADRVFDVASIYKLFFVYDGYQQIEAGAISADTPFVTTSDYRANTYTYGECLDLMIRESYNGCADVFYNDQKATARVETLINTLNLKATANNGLTSTAADLTELLKLYYEHSGISEGNWQKITDSMLTQPATKIDSVTTYNWRQGLPSGFSNYVKVYNKVGWAWNETLRTWTTHADAAIVEFPQQNRHYIIVILTSSLPGPSVTPITNLGTLIEDAIISNDNKL